MKPRLLLVDDSEMVRDLVVRFVGDDFDEIEQATDGGGALRLLQERLARGAPLPTVIVSDMDMKPGMCGEEFVRELAKDARLASIPVLLSSSEPDVRETARKLGVHAFEKRGSIVAIRDVILQLVATVPVQSMAVATEAADPNDALVRDFHDKLLRVRALVEEPDVHDDVLRLAIRKVLDDTTPVVDGSASRIAALEAETGRLREIGRLGRSVEASCEKVNRIGFASKVHEGPQRLR